MNKRIKSTAAVLFAATLILTGCGSSSSSKKKSTTLQGSTNGFPGGTVEANYVSDDGKAFSNGNQTVIDDLRLYWNKSNGQAIGVFTTASTFTSAGQNLILIYVAWYDGTVWHAPVEIFGQNEDPDAFPTVPMVLWLNTAGNTNAAALARNGDAIIVFTRSDADPAVAADADDNVRLYGTYFDVSGANTAAAGTIVGGFDTLATVIDYDNAIAAVNTTFGGAGGPDPDVAAVAFASDSLVGSHELTSESIADSGDPTTFVQLMYCKDPTEGDPTLATDVVGLRWWAVPFDLTLAGNALPVGAATHVLGIGSLDTAAILENVSTTVTVHNGHVLTTVSNVSQTPSTDQALIGYALGTGLPTVLGELNSVRQDDSNDTALRPAAAHVYGADHGLSSTLFFFEETGFQDAGANGSRSANRDFMLGELRVAAGVTTIGTGSPLEVDGLLGTIDTTNADADTFTVRVGSASTSPGAVSTNTLQTRINRSGTAIFATWLAPCSDRTDFDDSVATGNPIGSHTTNLIPFVTAVQTRLDSADARLLNASVAPVVTDIALVSTQHSTSAGVGAQDGAANVRFQEGLAGGQATSQANAQGALNGVPCDRGSTFQGNHLRASWVFTQSSDQGGADIDNVVLYLNGATITLGATPLTLPSIALTNTTNAAGRVEEVDTAWFGGIQMEAGEARAVDAGDASATAAAGRVLVFFPSNGNNPLEPVAGSFDEARLFVSEQTATGTAGSRAQVSTDPAGTFQPNATQHLGLLGLLTVPVNANTVTSLNHVGTRTHIYWLEERNVPGPAPSFNNGRRLVTRSYEQGGITATIPVAVADRFVPVLPAGPGLGAPTQIDIASAGDLLSPILGGVLRAGRNGSTVGVYFDEDLHVYYAETTSDATGYPADVTGPNPAVVDNDSNFIFSVLDYSVAFQPVGNNLPKSQVIFIRFDPNPASIVTIERIFVRSHN